MMSAQTIAHMSRQAARQSVIEHKLPFIVWPEDLALWRSIVASGRIPRLPFPALGDRTPRGFKLERELFVDASGWGSESEPAITATRMINEEIKVGMAYSIGDQGQFQVYVREWTPGPTATQRNRDERQL